jgi:hypothetical protein
MMHEQIEIIPTDQPAIDRIKRIVWTKAKQEGSDCPCCGQFAKAYERSITSAMSYGLIKLYQHTPDYIHLENFFKSIDVPSSVRGDMTKFKHFNCLEPHVDKRDDGSNRNGFWRITGTGVAYVKGEIALPKWALIYNGKAVKYSEENRTITETLKSKFNYQELMNPCLGD